MAKTLSGNHMRIWQNVIYKRCPDCDAQFQPHPKGYLCPTIDCSFFITREGLARILLDDTHAAIRYANDEQRQIVNRALQELGINGKL